MPLEPIKGQAVELPPSNTEVLVTPLELLPYFDRDRARRNLEFMAGISAEISLLNLVDSHIKDFEQTRLYVAAVAEQYLPFIERLAAASSFSETVREEAIGISFDSSEPRTNPIDLAAITQFCREQLVSASDPLVFVAPSHTLTYATRQAAETVLPKGSKVGFMVFDAHADLSRLEDETDVMKASVFAQIIDNFKDVVSIIGVRDREGIVHPNDSLGLIDFVALGYDQRKHAVSLADPQKYVREDRAIDRERFIQAVKEQIEKMKAKGVTHILTSVDLDILGRHADIFTAFEYNHMNIALYLGMLDLADSEPVQEIYKGTEEYMQDIEVSYRRSPLNYSEEHIEKGIDNHRQGRLKLDTLTLAALCVEAFQSFKPRASAIKRFLTPELQDDTRALQLAKTYHLLKTGDAAQFDGYSVDDLVTAIKTIREECAREGIFFGIALPNGGSLRGDVVEGFGPDVDGNTARAAQQIMQAMVQ